MRAVQRQRRNSSLNLERMLYKPVSLYGFAYKRSGFQLTMHQPRSPFLSGGLLVFLRPELFAVWSVTSEKTSNVENPKFLFQQRSFT